MKCRSSTQGHSGSLKNMTRTITMQEFTLAAIARSYQYCREIHLNSRHDIEF